MDEPDPVLGLSKTAESATDLLGFVVTAGGDAGSRIDVPSDAVGNNGGGHEIRFRLAVDPPRLFRRKVSAPPFQTCDRAGGLPCDVGHRTCFTRRNRVRWPVQRSTSPTGPDGDIARPTVAVVWRSAPGSKRVGA